MLFLENFVHFIFVQDFCVKRLASKTTDVNWTKAKDLGDHMGYYKARSRTTSTLKDPFSVENLEKEKI